MQGACLTTQQSLASHRLNYQMSANRCYDYNDMQAYMLEHKLNIQ